MSDNNKNFDIEKNAGIKENDNLSLNDDRRVKVLTPGAMVAKRFFRNRIAVVGLIILAIMFIFSFLGGIISPYDEKQFFYKYDGMVKEMAGAKENTELRDIINDPETYDVMAQATAILNINLGNETFNVNGKDFTIVKVNDDMYEIYCDGKIVGVSAKGLVYYDEGTADFDLQHNILKAFYSEDETLKTFEYNGSTFAIDEEGGINKDGKEVGYVSTYIVNAIADGVTFTRDFKEKLQTFLEENDEAGNFKRDGENEKVTFDYLDPETNESTNYVVKYNAADSRWVIKIETSTYVYDIYAAPSKDHWLGTDSNGMDMLTRLMYGGRVSLIIGFIVVIIETGLGIIMGGISGYFGGWVDMLIMRIVDIMYCIPSTPILIIIGAAMDALNVDPKLRMLYLMLILGFLGWPGVAQMVRGQILSLREQEFMTATEATGLSVKRRIFKHLIPNVIPQLIVSATMGLGGAIITEATLSFLGLGVRFPFASWGNIINDVNNTYVLTTYLWVWIPAGICILLTVLAFNLVGDGLRDAFDPRMKR